MMVKSNPLVSLHLKYKSEVRLTTRRSGSRPSSGQAALTRSVKDVQVRSTAPLVAER